VNARLPQEFDLSVKNPNGGEAGGLPQRQDIMDQIAALDAIVSVLQTIRGLP
jgi:hypothetical protein